jgi:hypothetical protein
MVSAISAEHNKYVSMLYINGFLAVLSAMVTQGISIHISVNTRALFSPADQLVSQPLQPTSQQA